MAKCTGQEIPGSLSAEFSRLFYMRKAPGQTAQVPALNPSRNQRTQTIAPSLRAVLATKTARWFADTWGASLTKADRSEIFAARKQDILEGTFPGEFWQAATITADTTEWAVPFNVKYPVTGVNPLYLDPLRQQTYCDYKTWTTSYPTPADDSNPAQPRPGWHGEVIDTYFRDLWHAQRRIAFLLPRALVAEIVPPLILVLDGTITATATKRGVTSWFQFLADTWLVQSTSGNWVPNNKVLRFWVRGTEPALELPPEDPYGWTYAKSMTQVRDFTAGITVANPLTVNRAVVRIATPPSMGRYFGLNDMVEVHHAATVTLYMARNP